MRTIKKMGAQGDVIFRKVDALPGGSREVPRDARGFVLVTHSETGHDHVIKGAGVAMFEDPANPLVGFLRLEVPFADVEHLRSFDTHETLRLDGGAGSVYEIRRQREFTPEGWRRVED